MALTPLFAAEYPNEGGRRNALDQPGAPLQVAYGKWTATVAGTGTAKIIQLPPGRIRVFPLLSTLLTGDGSLATADLHVGYAAYTNSADVAVAGDDNAFLDNADLGGGALSGSLLLPAATTSLFTEFDSQAGIDIEIMIDTANASIGETVEIAMVYTKVS